MAELKIFAIGESGLQNLAASITQPSGGGSGGGGLEARIAKLEATVEHINGCVSEIKTDLRTLLFGIVGSFILLAGMMIAGYLLLADKLDRPPQVQVISVPVPAPKQP